MKITVLASGSKGNSTLIETETKNILIDAGLPLSNLEKRIEKKFPNIDLLIITHTHIDHIKGIKSIIKKYKPVIYTSENDLSEKIPEYKNIKYDREIDLDNISINLFPLSHDVPCVGVSLVENGKELIYITDTGYIKEKTLNKYKNKDIYILESNYDPKMLSECSRPFHIKQRIRSDKGHLSNEDTCRYLKTLVGEKTKYLCLAHLSEDNNKPELAKTLTEQTLKEINSNVKEVIICSQTNEIHVEL